MRSLGIIGAGTIGQKHAAAAQAVGIPVAMVADQDLEAPGNWPKLVRRYHSRTRTIYFAIPMSRP